jgi:hypothetical protein
MFKLNILCNLVSYNIKQGNISKTSTLLYNKKMYESKQPVSVFIHFLNVMPCPNIKKTAYAVFFI